MSQIDPNIDIARGAYYDDFVLTLETALESELAPNPLVAVRKIRLTGIQVTLTADGETSVFVIAHNLNTVFPGIFPLRDSNGSIASEYTAQVQDANTIIISFDSAPNLGLTFTALIVG